MAARAPGNRWENPDFVLLQTPSGLGLCARHRPDWTPLVADWCSPEQRRRIAGGKRQLLVRAVGLHRHPGMRVLDATGGLGRDAFTLAALGARVTLTERQPLVCALLRDAQTRALADPACAAAAARIEIREIDAAALSASEFSGFDAAHLDPMYPDDGKSALPQKGMQMLRELAGDDLDADALLGHLAAQIRRVAVKRPLRASWLADTEPDVSIEGTQARFDIYLKPS